MRPAHRAHPPLEELDRIVVGFRLHILRQRQKRRPALGRVEQHRERLRQGGEELRGAGDPVPVARHGTERVIHRDRRVAEMLHLLQHRVGQPVGEGVAGEQQHRQPVRVRDTRGGHHVGGTRPDRGGGEHEAPPPHRLGIGDRGERHALLVLPAPGREHAPGGLQRLAQTGHVAVPEDREPAGNQRHFLSVDLGELRRQIAHQRLRHGQPHGLHCSLPSGALLPVRIRPQLSRAGATGVKRGYAAPSASRARRQGKSLARRPARKNASCGNSAPAGAHQRAHDRRLRSLRHTPFRAGADGADPVRA